MGLILKILITSSLIVHYLELKEQNYLTNLLTLGITNVNLSLLLIGCDDYDEELNKNVFKFVHHFIDSTGRL